MKDKCYAPVFEGNNFIACIFLALIYLTIIVALIILIFIPSIRCLIKQLSFRIRNCVKGNSEPGIPL